MAGLRGVAAAYEAAVYCASTAVAPNRAWVWRKATFVIVPSMNAIAEPMMVAASTKAPIERATHTTLFAVSASASSGDNFFRFPKEQASGEGMGAAQAEVNCSLGNYISNENMSQQESIDLVKKVGKRAASEMMENHSRTAVFIDLLSNV